MEESKRFHLVKEFMKLKKICTLIDELRSLEIFKEKWTNYRITLTEEGGFNTEFSYIPEEDHWPGLYMKAVSDLKEDE
ncbi:immunity protein YezG family protein [Acinetobacter sp. TUM15113]|uniref:immunity protein YezG family protein n=1 Tax=Acinetobacter sp. TUM15113 TaxID=2609140 RepID=UPI001C071533|nr:immunity protein YezG family protein [Acinetobacter sp. TUM15113]